MKSAIDRVSEIRTGLILRERFFGVLASKLKLAERGDIETACTDGINLWVNPAFVSTLTDAKLTGLIMHEVQHCSNGHFARKQWREHDLANIAADYAINGPILAAGYELPDGALVDPRFNGMGFEDVYRVLEQEKEQQSSSQGNGNSDPAQDESGDQTGDQESDDPGSDPGKCGGFCEPGSDENGDPVDTESLAQEWEQFTRQAAKIAERSGDLSEMAKGVIEDLNRSQVNWRDTLSQFINERISQDYSFSRPNRRYLQSGFVMPSLVPDSIGELVFFVDTSGSMDRQAFRAVLSEIQSLLDSGLLRAVHVVQGDYKLRHVETYETGEEIAANVYGCGFTDFRECMAHIGEEFAHCAAMIGFTDLLVEPDEIGDDPGIPAIWAAWGSRVMEQRMATPEFGEIMRLTPEMYR